MKNTLAILLVVISLSVVAQTKIDSIGINKLNGGIKALEADADLIHANWGFCIMDPKTGKILASHEPEKSLMPASSQKVITTIAGINLLGADYRYKTYLEYDGVIGKDSVLTGNLYLRGTGDPTLGSARLDSALRFDSLMTIWAGIIKSKGINKITGKIISDASYFEDYATPGSWNWDDIGQYYGAGPYGLNVFENTYTVYFSSTASKCRIDSIYPVIDGMTVWNDVTVGGGGDEAYIYGAPDNYYRYVTGTIPANRKAFTVDGSMPDPPLFLALELKKALLKNNIKVEQPVTTVYAMGRENIAVNKERKILYTHYSPALSDIIYHTNQKSINLYAEAILKTIGRTQLNDGSRESGTKAVNTFYANKGINLDGMNVEDGSGLSRMNVFTTNQMCSILMMEMKQATFADFKTSLPIAGKTGTLKTIGDGTAAAGKVFAKSGSMYKVRSYSGYVQTKSGELLSFCIVVNNYTCGTAEIKAKLEKMMILMAGL
ncbi:MAG: D-alanyl-D-alanine carboxypeptidase/D-alanyl-D-alanine-endopeptidase [Bacteroidetes bacterium]|nr:D-alanyl-D-alanine carboxypeptidase/D-alanyl-D-alanine-endopeptidase [Bacteroidota bacterium]